MLAHVATGSGLLLLTALALQVQMVQQLIPVVRFDGYFILSDLAGVPDLFSRVGPVLRSLRPGHPVDPRVSELRPRARRFVTAWVLVVVPLLTAAVVWFVWALPQFVEHGRRGSSSSSSSSTWRGSGATGRRWPWPSSRSPCSWCRWPGSPSCCGGRARPSPRSYAAGSPRGSAPGGHA